MKGFELTAAPDADVLDVAKAIVKIVDMPFGTRPFRVHTDPAQDGAEIVKATDTSARGDASLFLSADIKSDCKYLEVPPGAVSH
jgi:hypothetical protein